ncbi:hypothetical protein C7S16_6961 [Burkholderia thailandensis]|uniref:Uncharacterized protein n=1 Tax=Burkholderia thailandensis TaxID=57975 RepID=A0AAW9CSA1_BURTH|nr:hypothetical protein [Burkholderia thailandensis]MDW9250689.1 hypothetical protein [Burkholderia thailandensis]
MPEGRGLRSVAHVRRRRSHHDPSLADIPSPDCQISLTCERAAQACVITSNCAPSAT